MFQIVVWMKKMDNPAFFSEIQRNRGQKNPKTFFYACLTIGLRKSTIERKLEPICEKKYLPMFDWHRTVKSVLLARYSPTSGHRFVSVLVVECRIEPDEASRIMGVWPR
jgi:hypothetical protein